MITRRQFGVYASAISVSACASSMPIVSVRPRLSAAQVKSDVDLVEQAYERIHPGYTRYSDVETLRAAWNEIRNRSQREGGMSLGELYLDVERTLTKIRCDHTKAELPKALRDERETAKLYLPFRWELVEGRGFVTVPLKGSPLRFGDEVVEIDGRTLAKVVQTVSPLVPYDGYTAWARRGGITESLEFMGGAVDHFGALIWDIPTIATLKVRRSNGRTERIQLERITFQGWTDLSGGTGSAANFKDAVRVNMVGDNTAILTVDTFVNYREPVDPETIYGPIFDQLRVEQCNNLIVDLRQNGGGSTDASHGLVSYLISAPLRIKTDMRVKTLDYSGIREHVRTWDQSVLNPNPNDFIRNDDGTLSLKQERSDEMDEIFPKSNAFQGRVFILTSDQNSSGSTNISAVLQSAGQVTLVGEPTGGSAEGTTAGVLFTFEMPESGIRTRIPIYRYTNNVTKFERGMGVTPNIAAPRTVMSFLNKTDLALEAAMAAAGKD